MSYRTRNIAIALVLAAVAALLTASYVSRYKRHVQSGEATVAVYVAARDIAAGLTGQEVVERHLLTRRDVLRRTVVPGAISSPAQLGQLIATQPVLAGEQVSLRRFGTLAEQGIGGALTGTLRALQVPGDASQLLVGTLKTGDRVDLVASIPTANDDHAARIVLRNLRVIQAPSAPSGGKLTSGNGAQSYALLAVHDTQVQRLFWVLENAEWSLELRPALDAADSADVVETGATLARGSGG